MSHAAPKPTAVFVAASWLSLGVGLVAYCAGLWNAPMALDEKGLYLTMLMFGLFAAVSLQKTVRDRMMCELDGVHPGYGFARHKGYSTPEHFEALRRLGPCPIHRRSFAPVLQAQYATGDLFAAESPAS